MNTIADPVNDILQRVRSLEDRGLTISPARLAEAFGMTQSALADIAKVHRNTLSASPKSERLQSTGRDMLRVLQAAREINSDVDAAIYWMRNAPIAAFDYQTAMELIRKGKAQAVIDYLESISGGATG